MRPPLLRKEAETQQILYENTGMLVDVIKLRFHGEKRPRADIRADVPVRGELQLDVGRPGWHAGQKRPPQLAGLVVPGGVEWALPPLDEAWVRKIRGNSMLIIGTEEIRRDRRTVDLYPQSWWCRLVDHHDDTPRQVAAAARPTADALSKEAAECSS